MHPQIRRKLTNIQYTLVAAAGMTIVAAFVTTIALFIVGILLLPLSIATFLFSFAF